MVRFVYYNVHATLHTYNINKHVMIYSSHSETEWGSDPVQNQQSREWISARKTSHKHNKRPPVAYGKSHYRWLKSFFVWRLCCVCMCVRSLLCLCDVCREPINSLVCGFYQYSSLFRRLRSPIVQELCESRGGRPGLSVLRAFWFPWT